jgi:hypothetical protein
VALENGGNLWVTNTDVRACGNGLEVGTGGAAPAANLIALDSRFAECNNGVLLVTLGAQTATGWISNCTASLCANTAFTVESASTANADLTLTNCRAVGNGGEALALFARTAGSGNATMRLAYCVVTVNATGIVTLSTGGGTASVLGTNPGTNLISGNRTGNSTTASTSLQ